MQRQEMKPNHPGQILKELYIAPLRLSQLVVANHLGITRKTLSMLLNGRQGISAEMALRLGKAFGTTPDLWVNLQKKYDLWQARTRVDLKVVRKFSPSLLQRITRISDLSSHYAIPVS